LSDESTPIFDTDNTILLLTQNCCGVIVVML
jgi:hypothetical protein